jgi:NADPH:quinone reductase-like Zn-dependent oxidoreductase
LARRTQRFASAQAANSVAHLVDAGQLKSAMDRTYPLEQAVESRESALY